MKIRRFLASLLAVVMLTTTVAMADGPILISANPNSGDATKYVTLDGEWNFKLYRTYPNMYQYFPYTGVNVKWEDTALAAYPADGAWKSWDALTMPADNTETGGLLTHDLMPSWSEAWIVREFDLPKNFTKDETVTLLLGIVDDNDVIYINGTAVAASGFVDGNGASIVDVPALGGFDYAAEDPAAQVKWAKSYWNIGREYTIPASALKQGETNEIAIRLYNNNDFGGFYSGNVYAICGNDLAVRALKGLPTDKIAAPAVEKAAKAQLDAINAGDSAAYAATISDNYHNDAQTKADKLADFAALTAKGLTAEDANTAVYLDDEGYYWYSAVRVWSDGATEEVELCFDLDGDTALERGNWNRCYGTSYDSTLFGQALTYSVYLPPSYYENDDVKYPTVWLLHGMNSSSGAFRDVDKIGAFMDELIHKGDVEEMVLIMPDSGKNAGYQDSELGDSKEDSGYWRTQLTDELRKVAEGNYRLIPDAKFRGLTGISMGGFGAMSAGTANPQLYSSVGAHMPYLPEQALSDLKALTPQQLADYDFYLDCGLQDARVGTEGTIAVHDYLVSAGKEHGYDLRDGGHNSAFYMAGMGDSMKMHSDHFVANGLAEAKTAYYNPFADVKDDSYFAKAVQWAVENDVTSGVSDKAFGSYVPCTRAHLVTFLHKMEGKPVVNYLMQFTDVDEDAYYAEAVRWAAANKIVAGNGDNTFSPEAPLTREALACILHNYAKSKGIDVSVGEDTNILSYTDAFEVSEWAMPAMQWACGAGVISGSNGALNPGATADRAQTVQMLYNFVHNVK